MRVPTVKLRHKRRNHLIIKVNVQDYASDLGRGRYAAYELVRGELDDSVGAKVDKPPESTVHEVGTPKKKRAYKRRTPKIDPAQYDQESKEIAGEATMPSLAPQQDTDLPPWETE